MGYIASLLPTWCLAEVSGGNPQRGWEWKASLEESVEAVNRWAGQGRAGQLPFESNPFTGKIHCRAWQPG